MVWLAHTESFHDEVVRMWQPLRLMLHQKWGVGRDWNSCSPDMDSHEWPPLTSTRAWAKSDAVSAYGQMNLNAVYIRMPVRLFARVCTTVADHHSRQWRYSEGKCVLAFGARRRTRIKQAAMGRAYVRGYVGDYLFTPVVWRGPWGSSCILSRLSGSLGLSTDHRRGLVRLSMPCVLSAAARRAPCG